MNRLKSLFVSAHVSLAFSLTGLALWSAWAHDPALWLPVALVAAPQAAFFARLYLAPVARTSANLNLLLAAAALGWLGTLAAAAAGDRPLADAWSLAAVAAATVMAVSSLLYIYWYSRFPARNHPALAVGARLPGFELTGVDGQRLSSQQLVSRPTVWIFFRGNWCPLCMAQIHEVAGQYRELQARGAQVVLISPQPPGHTQALARRVDAPMQFMCDPDNAAARRLGILAEGGLPTGLQVLGYDSDVPLPTVIITATGGSVLYADTTNNYRIRPEPDAFLQVLDAHLRQAA